MEIPFTTMLVGGTYFRSIKKVCGVSMLADLGQQLGFETETLKLSTPCFNLIYRFLGICKAKIMQVLWRSASRTTNIVPKQGFTGWSLTPQKPTSTQQIYEETKSGHTRKTPKAT
jgi:hypothetical protein